MHCKLSTISFTMQDTYKCWGDNQEKLRRQICGFSEHP